MILPDSAGATATRGTELDSSTTEPATLTVAQAVDALCAYCAEQWKDYLHARAGQRDADHREWQLGMEVNHAEEGQYLSQRELDALDVESDRAVRLASIRTKIAEAVAESVFDNLWRCNACAKLTDVLFPRQHSQQMIGSTFNRGHYTFCPSDQEQPANDDAHGGVE